MSSSSPALPSSTALPVDPKLAKPQAKRVKATNAPPKKLSPQKKKQVKQTQANEEADDEDLEEEDSFIGRLKAMSGAWLFSMIFHLVLLLGLGLYTLSHIGDKGPIFLTAGEVSENVDDMIEVPLDMKDLEFEEELDNPSELLDESQDSQLLSEIAPELPAVKAVALSDFGSLSNPLETELGGSLAGMSDALKKGGKPTLFTSGGPVAKTVVYIVDNSNSMTGGSPQDRGYGRMETALVELSKSINSLEESQKFYIIFFSDAAYGTFHPQTAKTYVRATDANKKKVNYWLDTVECCFRTDAKEAFEMARALKPELIYLLGDGAFTDNSDRELIKNPIKGVRMEVLGMNLQGKAAQRFKALASAHEGKYRDVGLTEDGEKILKEFGPRKRNGRRGPVWGIKLPVARNKK